MWSLRDASPADAELLFWRLDTAAQEDYREREKLPIAHMQWLIMDSAWVKVLDYGQGPVAIMGAIPLGRCGKGLVWYHSTPMADSRPYRVAKALKMAILELSEVFPHGLCAVLDKHQNWPWFQRVGFDLREEVEVAGRKILPMELV